MSPFNYQEDHLLLKRFRSHGEQKTRTGGDGALTSRQARALQDKPLMELFKPGIVVLVLITGAIGYALSLEVEHQFRIWHAVAFLIGLAAISAGSFALNQAQEWSIDVLMARTNKRPIPTGKISARRAMALGIAVGTVGLILLYFVSPLAMALSLLTAILYNVFYTLIWKRRWSFGAVPGAIPGAMPVMIGFSANSSKIFSTECMYMFLVMFLWQMPHFWALAIRYREDYKKGGVPVLPTTHGVDRTLYHMGLYVFVYVALALASPWFFHANYLYLLIAMPFALKVFWEFIKYFRASGEANWLGFFMWVNFSVIVFMVIPVIEKWSTYFLSL